MLDIREDMTREEIETFVQDMETICRLGLLQYTTAGGLTYTRIEDSDGGVAYVCEGSLMARWYRQAHGLIPTDEDEV
ncbi:hypothetical protein [Micromonospora sp. NPDC007220]|uniref:hypothetical protein n=1 Tax=Micromonospora sp. NPDC007220 TaxID=3154318 RepID=UPI0033E54B92